MSKYFGTIFTVIIIITLSVLGLTLGFPSLNRLQLDTLIILVIICGSSALYCFIVGELTHNNSQMDKLWSILPIAYTWVIAVKGDFKPRLVLFAVVATLWGIRLTINFARKGAYKLKFWEGEEDYRWAILRKQKYFQNKGIWALFNLFFISIYQNVLVLFITLPSLACMKGGYNLVAIDYIGVGLALIFLLIETAADEQQMSFYKTRGILLKLHNNNLSALPAPFNKGFNTTGLWGYSRHPNYLGEQGIWLSLYLLVIGAGAANYGIFNWSMIGPLFLVLLFLGSSSLGESISMSKYKEYSSYVKSVFKYIPIRKYRA